MYPLGGDVSVTGRFRRTQIRYDEPEDSTVVAQDLDEDAIGFSLDNYRKDRGFSWATRYTSFETQYVFYPSYE